MWWSSSLVLCASITINSSGFRRRGTIILISGALALQVISEPNNCSKQWHPSQLGIGTLAVAVAGNTCMIGGTSFVLLLYDRRIFSVSRHPSSNPLAFKPYDDSQYYSFSTLVYNFFFLLLWPIDPPSFLPSFPPNSLLIIEQVCYCRTRKLSIHTWLIEYSICIT